MPDASLFLDSGLCIQPLPIDRAEMPDASLFLDSGLCIQPLPIDRTLQLRGFGLGLFKNGMYGSGLSRNVSPGTSGVRSIQAPLV
jgi:hypothetical protein